MPRPDLAIPGPDGGGVGADGSQGGEDGGGTPEGGVTVTPGSVENGLPCSSAADCKSTFCRDSVCCSARCDGTCQACAESYTGMPNGTCAPVKDGMDPNDSCASTAPETCGNDGQCNGAGACRKHGANQTCAAAACTGAMFMPARSCDGAGSCATSTEVSCGTYPCTPAGCAKPCTATPECGAGAYCAAGTCRALKQNGEGCGAAAECTSTFCVDGVCCDNACTGTCQACSEMATGQRSGRCQPVQPGLDPDNECASEAPTTCGRDGTCDGSGGCRKYGSNTTCAEASCSGSMFTPARKCASGVCAPAAAMDCGTAQCAVEGCRQGCAMDVDCGVGTYCAAGTCAAKKGAGESCTAGAQCTSAACIDGVCCETACAGKCYACSMSKTGQANGKCAAIAAGNDPDNECAAQADTTCGTDGACNGTGACRLWAQGTKCASGMCSGGNYLSDRTCDGLGTCRAATTDVCAPNTCGATGCNRTCTMDSECVGSTYCTGTTCAAKKATGTACTAANQCATNFCADGFCCDAACAGKCAACSMAKTGQANGKCASVPAGQDPDNECAPVAGMPCGLDGMCNGAGACRVTTAGTACGTATCANPNTFTPAGVCDGVSACAAGAARACSGGLTCASATACKTTCATATDCVAGNYCAGGMCLPKKGNGVACSTAAECTNGFCAGGTCCNVACNATGGCQSCSTGTCVTSGATVCSNMCVNTATNPAHCSGCGIPCAAPTYANGVATCRGGTCVPGCAANYLYCPASNDCKSSVWNFDTTQQDGYYTNGNESPGMVSTAQRHSGTRSYELVPAFSSGTILNRTTVTFLSSCSDGFEVSNKTVAAWIYVSADWGTFNARCNINYYDGTTSSTVASPWVIPARNPSAWKQITHTFPATAARPSAINVDCSLPGWDFDASPTPPSMRMYVDDFSIN